jgi:hypothetical protein
MGKKKGNKDQYRKKRKIYGMMVKEIIGENKIKQIKRTKQLK